MTLGNEAANQFASGCVRAVQKIRQMIIPTTNRGEGSFILLHAPLKGHWGNILIFWSITDAAGESVAGSWDVLGAVPISYLIHS